MTVYVTVELCQGLFVESGVYASLQGAKEAEARWLAAHRIDDRETRQAKADNGTEFHVIETQLQP